MYKVISDFKIQSDLQSKAIHLSGSHNSLQIQAHNMQRANKDLIYKINLTEIQF